MFSQKGLDFESFIKLIDESDPKMKFLDDIGKITSDKLDRYKELYKFCDEINSVREYNGKTQAQTTRLKGQALETLLKYTIESTGGLFETYENLGTGTNEIDLFVKLTNRGKLFERFVDGKYQRILCECKNHNSHVGVEYVGKFYSLVETSKINMSILVSWLGLAGKDWSSSVGLTKKIHLLRENPNERIYILDFNKKDFQSLAEGESLIKILDKKCEEMELSIDYSKYFMRHPNQNELETKIDLILKERNSN